MSTRDHNTYSNDTSEALQTLNSTKNNNCSYILLVTTGIGLIISVKCLVYITLKLSINKYIKTILFTMSIHKIISFSLMTLSTAFMIGNDSKNHITCLLITQPQMFVMKSNRMLTCLISIIRYLLTWKASKAKIVPEKYLGIGITLGISIPYLTMLANWSFSLDRDNLFKICLDGEASTEMPYPLQFALNIVLALLSLSIGLYFDIQMLAFVRKRRKVDPLPMVPWRSNYDSDEEIGVPLRATITSSVYLLIFLVMFVVFGCWFNDFWVIMTIVSLIHIPPLPMLLAFTIKQQNKCHVAQPPGTLQFHDETSEPKNDLDQSQLHQDLENGKEELPQVLYDINELNVVNLSL